MPASVSSGIMPANDGDVVDAKTNGGAHVVNTQELIVGTAGGKSTTYNHLLARFELAIPDGATIYSVKLTLGSTLGSYSNGAYNATTNRWEGGFIAVDGKFNTAAGAANGFNPSSPYANRAALPVVEFVTSPYSYTPAKFHGGAPAFSNQTFAAVASGAPTLFSIGEGTTVTNAVTGLVSQLQSYLNTNGATIRSGSASGVDLPVLFHLYRLHNAELTDWGIGICTVNHPTVAARPVLTVEYDSNLGVPSGTPNLGASLSGRESVGTALSADGNTSPMVGARLNGSVAITAKPSLVSQPISGRGGIR